MNKKEKREFRLSESVVAYKKAWIPVLSWASAHLFYGVPFWAKHMYRDFRTGEYVFTE